jgi:hypothetical protein
VGTRGLTVTENGKGSGVGTLGLERWRGLRLGDAGLGPVEGAEAWRDGGGARSVGRWRGGGGGRGGRGVGRAARKGGERLGGARRVGRRLCGGSARRRHGVRTE